MARDLRQTELSKPLAGFLFLLFWAVAIVAWCFVPGLEGHGLRGFIADVGITFAALGFSVVFFTERKQLSTALMLAIVGIALFAVGDFTGFTLLVYFLRIGIVLLALMQPVFKLSNTVKIWS
jgi:hypothetical protein